MCLGRESKCNDRLKFANSIKTVNNEATQIFAQHFFFLFK